MIGSVLAVFCFEWKRSFTWPRMMWWLVLMCFPIFIMGLVRYNALNAISASDRSQEVFLTGWLALCAWLLFALIPMLVAMLGTLLWTTPAISAELERKSWIYLAVRPHGSLPVVIGKYLTAVTWVFPPAILGLTIAVLLAGLSTWTEVGRVWWTMLRLVLLSVPAYGAIYLLIGVLLPRRAMTFAVAYTLIFELVISFVPAVINKLTVQYRLRSLLVEWCELSLIGPNGRPLSTSLTVIGTEPAWQHVLILLAMSIGLVGLSVVVLKSREFSSSAESET